MSFEQSESRRLSRRPFLAGLAGATAASLAGFSGTASAASPCSAVSFEFAGGKVAKVRSASMLSSLTVYYVDKNGNRAMQTDIAPTQAAQYGLLQIRYSEADDMTIIEATGRKPLVVRVVGQGTDCETAATNPNIPPDVLNGFNSAPTASFEVSNATPQVGEAVTFTSTATDPDLPNDRLAYEWDLDGDGTYETRGQQVTYTYDSTGDVTVSHRVTDGFGETNTAQQTISPQASDLYQQAAKLTATDAAPVDQFGHTVAVSGDTAIVGTPTDDDAGESSGSAYVFVRSGGSWTQQAKLTADDAAAGDIFGFSVSIADDTVAIGAPGNDDAGFQSGSAYVFVRSGESWTQQAKLTATDAAAVDFFGTSVSISADTAVVGAQYDDASSIDSGSAYVFVRSSGSWTQQARLIANDAEGSDYFGHSVAVSGDTAVIGAPYAEDTEAASGSAYVFVRSSASWTQQAQLTADNPATGDLFGKSVGVSGDTVVVGVPNDDDAGAESGSAYVFVQSSGNWTQQAKLTAHDVATHDLSGTSVSISGDRVVVGAPWDDPSGFDSGSANVFVRSDGSWSQRAQLTADDGASGDFFGVSAAVSSDTVVVGASGDDDAGDRSGSAYIFTK